MSKSGSDGDISKSAVKIKLLIMVAIADGVWDDREVALLEYLSLKIGVNKAEFDKIRQQPKLEVRELAFGLPSGNAERIDLVADLIKMAFADRKLHDNELEVLIRLGRVLGFQEDEMRTIVEEQT